MLTDKNLVEFFKILLPIKFSIFSNWSERSEEANL